MNGERLFERIDEYLFGRAIVGMTIRDCGFCIMCSHYALIYGILTGNETRSVSCAMLVSGHHRKQRNYLNAL